ncbi:Bifunctional nuclease 2 [Acorus calamus]|uniref:Bifunctional nuclease 2 n=1 Tax=Acorus calamus TaxID=4465 RepID=A0AAV9DNB2_ACOCL|nr:Bifunctional nuclease 2 [Acorus calamus]
MGFTLIVGWGGDPKQLRSRSDCWDVCWRRSYIFNNREVRGRGGLGIYCITNSDWQVPIQVNKNLAYSDGMRVVEPAKLAMQIPTDGLLFTEMDRSGWKAAVVELKQRIRRLVQRAMKRISEGHRQ